MSRRKLPHKHAPEKFPLLLDECLPVRSYFPRINNYHKVKHLVEDYNKDQLKDPEVYSFATSKGLILITKNNKHFEKLVTSDGAGIIGISGNMTPDKIDNKLFAFLARNTYKKLKGKYQTISSETEE